MKKCVMELDFHIKGGPNFSCVRYGDPVPYSGPEQLGGYNTFANTSDFDSLDNVKSL
jgi:hypothetical protein